MDSKLNKSTNLKSEFKKQNNQQIDSLLVKTNFTFILITGFFLVVITLLGLLAFNWYQAKSFDELTINTLEPLKVKLVQQNQLIRLEQLINQIIDLDEVENLPVLHAQLIVQSESLSLFNSENKGMYQQWFEVNVASTKRLKRFVDNYKSNIFVKRKSLIKLEKLIITSKNIQYNQLTTEDETILITNALEQFNELTVLITDIRFPMLSADYQENHQAIMSLLVNGSFNSLTSQINVNQSIARVIRGFQVLKDDLLRKEGLLNFQKNILLLNKYYQNIIEQQQELKIILSALLNPSLRQSSLDKVLNISKENYFRIMFLPVWLITLVTFSFISLCCLFSFLNKRLDVIKTALKMYQIESNKLRNALQRVDNIKQETNSSKAVEVNQILAVEPAKRSIITQEHHKDNYRQALRQLNLLGSTGMSVLNRDYSEDVCYHKASNNRLTNREMHESTQHVPQFQSSYNEALILANSLRQVSRYFNWQKGDRQYIATKVNLVEQLQADLLTLWPILCRTSNTITLSVDKKIKDNILVDIELFSDMFVNFVTLLLLQQTKVTLAINVKLSSKLIAKKKQELNFVACISQHNKIIQLPNKLKCFRPCDGESFHAADYFSKVLSYLGGGNLTFENKDNSFQSSFFVPVLLQEPSKHYHYPVFILPITRATNNVNVLNTIYYSMPIEVLVAVRQPSQWLGLCQIIHTLGLSIKLVVSEVMLDQCWKTGRYTILLSEFEYQAFTSFEVEQNEGSEQKSNFTRGVFSLAEHITIIKPEETYTHWIAGNLHAGSSLYEFESALIPWLNRKVKAIDSGQKSYNEQQEYCQNVQLQPDTQLAQLSIFKLDSYIYNQGSVDLAFFMLDVYIDENKKFVKALNDAFEHNDTMDIEHNMYGLAKNAKILASNQLTQLCKQWQLVELNQPSAVKEESQRQLLSDITQTALSLEKAATIIT